MKIPASYLPLDYLLSAVTLTGRDADLLIVVNGEIPADDLIVHFF